MIVANQKRKENIAEYLLYMWQVEDLIRASNFDMETIRKQVVDRYEQPAEVKEEIARWYEELIEMMRTEGVKEEGHIQLNKNVIIVLTDLHLRLLKTPKEMIYGAVYYKHCPTLLSCEVSRDMPAFLNLKLAFRPFMGIYCLKCSRNLLATKQWKPLNK